MSIASEITRITGNVSDSYTAANAKGATMPATQDSDHLAATIATIPSGITPTGTMYIISNGTYNVADKAIANVNVPTTAPQCYVAKEVDADGVLANSKTNAFIPFPAGTKSLGLYGFAYAYSNVPSSVLNGALDLKPLETLNSLYSAYNMFYHCTGITSVDASTLKSISGERACANMFYQCTGITSIDFRNLLSISGQNSCVSMFNSCTGLTGTLSLPSLNSISGTYSCQNMFAGCNGITAIDLSSLERIGDNYCCEYMFSACSGVTSLDLKSLISISGTYAAASMFSGLTSLTNLDLRSLVLIGSSKNICQGMFSMCSSLTSVTLPSLCKLGTQTSMMASMFGNCTSLTSLSFPNLAYTATNYNTCFTGMLNGCTGVTVHFPAEWETTMSSWTSVTGGFGGTNTTVLFDLPNVTTLDFSNIEKIELYGAFSSLVTASAFPNVTGVNFSSLKTIKGNVGGMCTGNTNLTSIDLSALETVSGANSCSSMCKNCTSLTGILDLGKLKTISDNSACEDMFYGCTAYTGLDLSSLESIDGASATDGMFLGCNNMTGALDISSLKTINGTSRAAAYMFNGTGFTSIDASSLTKATGNSALMNFFANNTNLTSVNLSSLTELGYAACGTMLQGCTALTSISFPSLKTVYNNNVFSNMLQNTTGCTVHFPSNMSSYNFNCGGTNTTVLYDLPATNTLTGADTKTYSRNPKYDTATALAWKVGAYGTTDFSPAYYTSGTSDPATNDTIYSDAACTTAETTISAIA